MSTNTTRNTTTTTRAWRRLFPTYAEHGVTRSMCPVEVRIVRDIDWDEYRCELWTDGAHRVNADYYTDDTADALTTSAAMLRMAVQQWSRDVAHASITMRNAINVD